VHGAEGPGKGDQVKRCTLDLRLEKKGPQRNEYLVEKRGLVGENREDGREIRYSKLAGTGRTGGGSNYVLD